MLELAAEDRGAGWFDLTFSNGRDEFQLEWLSDISDPWGSLARAALLIATGAFQAQADFEFEPGIKRLIVEAAWREGAGWINYEPRLRILDLGDERHEVEEQQIFATSFASRDEFGRAVLACLTGLHDSKTPRTRFGPNGFPDRAVAALRAALATRLSPEIERE